MAHKSRDAMEAGRALCDRWARDFDLRSGHSRDRQLITAQLHHDKRGAAGPRQAMAQLDLMTCVVVLVHYGDAGKLGLMKIDQVHGILGKKIAHRDYWRGLERASLLMAGFELASPLGVPARDMIAAESGETIPLSAEQIERLQQAGVGGQQDPPPA